MKNLVVIMSNIRSCYNVGSIFRTADAVGVDEIALCGITPYPRIENDTRSEKIIINNSRMIHKTALDAEESMPFRYFETTLGAIEHYSDKNLQIVALENKVHNTQNIFEFKPKQKVALVVGSETDGLDTEILKMCSITVEIPMHGIKNSLNVSVATGIALYALAKS